MSIVAAKFIEPQIPGNLYPLVKHSLMAEKYMIHSQSKRFRK
jgi:hypothetical protein